MSKERNTDFTLNSLDDLFTSQNERDNGYLPNIQDIPLELLDDFPNHPFRVRDDEDMLKLIESVSERGVLVPAIVRPKADGRYELISGHRRKRASECAEKKTLRCMVSDLDDDAATIIMVDSNIQRTDILPSEKAFAYKMKMDAMRRTAGRPTKENTRQNVGNYETADLIGKDNGESGRQVQRYIRLTELIPELLDLVDKKKLQFTVAIDISYIDKEVQGWIYEYISDTGFIKPKQIAALRNQLNDGPINQIQMLSIFNNCVMAKKVSRSLTFSEKKLTKYFPDDYTAKDMEQVIESLLEKWMQEQSC